MGRGDERGRWSTLATSKREGMGGVRKLIN